MGNVLFVKKQAPAPWILCITSQEEEDTAIPVHSSVILLCLPSSMEPICSDFPHPWEFTKEQFEIQKITSLTFPES